MDETGSRRRSLLPRWLLPALAAAAIVAIAGGAWAFRSSGAEDIRVPNVAGLDVPVARSRLVLAGLAVTRGDERFSATVPRGAVVEQRPGPGEIVPKGTEVVLVVSAGTETFPMPDVTGLAYTDARDRLGKDGLVVRIEPISSDRPKDVVVESLPAPGVTVSTSDIVVLRVSSGAGARGGLTPANLSGKRFVIDPAPGPVASAETSPSRTDHTLELTRRLRSLLQASGAEVVVTRSVSDTSSSEGDRAMQSLQAQATAVLGLSVDTTGKAGMALTVLPSASTTPEDYLGSVELSRELAAELRASKRTLTVRDATGDTVLLGAKSPGVRLTLGVVGDKTDAARLGDPKWLDGVATDIYRAIADLYGPAR